MEARHAGLTIHLLHGQNSDSGSWSRPADFPGIESFAVDKATLFPVIANLRVYKTDAERALLRYVSGVTSAAHASVMREAKPGMGEYQLEALFKFYIYMHGGMRHSAYTSICACGPNSAVLHYGHAGAPNERILMEGDIALLDGCRVSLLLQRHNVFLPCEWYV